jgi:hypothetical protein
VVENQCRSGIMAPAPGDPERVKTYHYCSGLPNHEVPNRHGCGCGYVWDGAGNRLSREHEPMREETKLSKQIKVRDADEYIANHETFNAGNLRGGWTSGHEGLDYGHLPESWRARLQETARVADSLYVVVSYQTPIAWVAEDGPPEARQPVIPRVRYSLTTTQHQYIAAHALGVQRWHAWGDDAVTKFVEVRAESHGRKGGW